MPRLHNACDCVHKMAPCHDAFDESQMVTNKNLSRCLVQTQALIWSLPTRLLTAVSWLDIPIHQSSMDTTTVFEFCDSQTHTGIPRNPGHTPSDGRVVQTLCDALSGLGWICAHRTQHREISQDSRNFRCPKRECVSRVIFSPNSGCNGSNNGLVQTANSTEKRKNRGTHKKQTAAPQTPFSCLGHLLVLRIPHKVRCV